MAQSLVLPSDKQASIFAKLLGPQNQEEKWWRGLGEGLDRAGLGCRDAGATSGAPGF